MSAKSSTPASKKTSPARTGAIKADKVAKAGSNTRVRAHLKTTTKRNQAKRDTR
jgi:hypothetical protein